MKVGFFNIFHGTVAFQHTIHMVLADMMIRSVRKSMPGVPIIQFTDMISPRISGVDDVERKSNSKAALLRIEHQIACEGDWLFLDTDVIVQKDVRSVFDTDFDIAISDRIGCITPSEGENYELYQKMPHNSGIVFSRCSDFWKAVLYHMQTVPPAKKEWMGDQYAVCDIIAQNKFNVKIVPGWLYNYPPLNLADKCKWAAIAHYKGPQRKEFMLERFAEV